MVGVGCVVFSRAIRCDAPEHRPLFRLSRGSVLKYPASSPEVVVAIRVVVAKVGLDGHDRGAKVVARALRDAGMEVIYTGLHQTPEQVVAAVVEEDAQAVGLSVHSGAHLTLFPRVTELLQQAGADDVLVFGGGIIPPEDVETLRAQGVAAVFTPGATMVGIVDWVRANVPQRT
jgi:methylmalonyl-CoA mutase C-terminal domain/subunit